jgi:hypothetical protein
MIPIEKLREIDPKLAGKSDAEIEEIRESLYGLAQLCFDTWTNDKKNK